MVDYETYMRSHEWYMKRLIKLRIDGVWFESIVQCERCKFSFPQHRIHIHHRTYERLGREPLSDLEIICQDCHALEHGATVADWRHISVPIARRIGWHRLKEKPKQIA